MKARLAKAVSGTKEIAIAVYFDERGLPVKLSSVGGEIEYAIQSHHLREGELVFLKGHSVYVVHLEHE